MEKLYTVSICMITYNHEKYIHEAIESVLTQQCDFEIELIVANDCSTDKTEEFIQNILQNHPRASLIKYMGHAVNKGMMPNFLFALQQCSGKYIALCDGDDYWTDSLKLQKQVDFMEINTNYAACFHNANIININNEISGRFCDWDFNKDITAKDIILKGGGIYPTASILFKNKIKLPDFTLSTRAGDTALALSLLNIGDFYYSKEIMCVYRKHEGGVYTSIHNDIKMRSVDIESNIKLLMNFRELQVSEFQIFFDDAIQKQLSRISNNFGFNKVLKLLIKNYIHLKDFIRFVSYKLKNKF